ncbi:MAG: hypothetical protein BWY83_01977 [bacterium ADurb.Bin478]|nr:MAG: hypothetical protein BWY83_01977 [bacterium ADurb.Bin478]
MNLRTNLKLMAGRLIGPALTLYRKIPPSLRFPSKIIDFFCWLKGLVRLNLWIITGIEPGSDRNLVIGYAGMEKNKNYLADQLFHGAFTEQHAGRIWFWNGSDVLKKRGYTCSLMVTELMRVFFRRLKGRKAVFVPDWVDGNVDISDENTLYRKHKSLESDLRRVRKFELDYEITKDPRLVEEFYYQMYQPYILRVHRDRAFLLTHDCYLEKMKKGELLLIKKGEERIAGTVLFYAKKVAYLWILGAKEGDTDYVKEGAFGALFYYSIHHVKGKGFNEVNFGKTRAFLNNGIIQFKAKRGIRILESSRMGFSLEPLTELSHLSDFFIRNPFIFEDKTGLNGALFFAEDHVFSEKDLDWLAKNYFLAGLSKLFLYQFGRVNDAFQTMIPADYADKMFIRSVDTLLHPHSG